jgi:hypothetical protein
MSSGRPSAQASLLAAVCALALLAAAAGPVVAAILGTLNPAMAAPGDWVELTTDAGPIDPNVYQSMAAEGPVAVYLQRADPASLGNSCDTPIGTMTWAGGVGSLRFQVPEVPGGPYWVLVLTQGACERFGTRTDLLTLTVRPTTAMRPSPAIVGGAVAIAVVLTVGAVLARRRRKDPDQPRSSPGSLR